MKTLISFFLCIALFNIFTSCSKVNKDETKKVESQTETPKDTVKKESAGNSTTEIKKYDTPTNTTVYVHVLPDGKNIIPISKMIDWNEKDINNYLDLNFTADNKEGTDAEEFDLESTDDGKIVAKYSIAKGYVEMKNVKIEGNKFYAVLTLNNVSEEFNGKFVKFKAPVKGESDYINGLLINRKGVWKFFFQYI